MKAKDVCFQLSFNQEEILLFSSEEVQEEIVRQGIAAFSLEDTALAWLAKRFLASQSLNDPHMYILRSHNIYNFSAKEHQIERTFKNSLVNLKSMYPQVTFKPIKYETNCSTKLCTNRH